MNWNIIDHPDVLENLKTNKIMEQKQLNINELNVTQR